MAAASLGLLLTACFALCWFAIARAAVSAREPKRANQAPALYPEQSACTSYQGFRLYVNFEDPPTVLVFRQGAKNAALPICTFTSSSLQGSIGGMTVDLSGKLWVSVASTPALVAFPHATNGQDVAPSQVISGGNTLLQTVGETQQQPATDAGGNLWVPVDIPQSGYVLEFGATANGNVAPITTLGYGIPAGKPGHMKGASGVAFDRDGNLWVAEDDPLVAVYAPPFSNESKPIAVYRFSSQVKHTAQFIGIDDANNVYLANQSECFFLVGGLKSNGKISRSFSMPDRSDGITVGSKNLFNSHASGTRGVDAFAPLPKGYDPIRTLSSPAFTDNPQTPAWGL